MKTKFLYFFISILLLICNDTYSQNSSQGYPSLDDGRFVLLVSDLEFDTNFHYLVENKEDNSVLVWLKISLPNVNVPDQNGKTLTKNGGYELVLYQIGCENKIAEEMKRLKLNEYGAIESVLFKYPYGGNKNIIVDRTFLDLLRFNACDLN